MDIHHRLPGIGSLERTPLPGVPVPGVSSHLSQLAEKTDEVAGVLIRAELTQADGKLALSSHVKESVNRSTLQQEAVALSNPAPAETAKKLWIVNVLLTKIQQLKEKKGVVSSERHEIKRLETPKMPLLKQKIDEQKALLAQLVSGKKLSFIKDHIEVTERVRIGGEFRDDRTGQSASAKKAVEYQLGALEWLARSSGSIDEKVEVKKLIADFCQNGWIKSVLENNPSFKSMAKELETIGDKELMAAITQEIGGQVQQLQHAQDLQGALKALTNLPNSQGAIKLTNDRLKLLAQTGLLAELSNDEAPHAQLTDFISKFPNKPTLFQATNSLTGDVKNFVRGLIRQQQCREMIRMSIDEQFYATKMSVVDPGEGALLQKIFIGRGSQSLVALAADSSNSTEMVMRELKSVAQQLIGEGPSSSPMLDRFVNLISHWAEANNKMPGVTPELRGDLQDMAATLGQIKSAYRDQIDSALVNKAAPQLKTVDRPLDMQGSLQGILLGKVTQDESAIFAEMLAKDITQYTLTTLSEVPVSLYSLSPKELINNPHEKQISLNYDNISAFATSQIMQAGSLEEAQRMIDFTITLADRLVQKNNFMMAHALHAALTSIPVFRLFHSSDSGEVEGLSDAGKATFKKLELLFTQAKNFGNLRKAQSAVTAESAVIPYFGLFATDITFAYENTNEVGRNYVQLNAANVVGRNLQAIKSQVIKSQGEHQQPLQTSLLQTNLLSYKLTLTREGLTALEEPQTEASFKLKPRAN